MTTRSKSNPGAACRQIIPRQRHRASATVDRLRPARSGQHVALPGAPELCREALQRDPTYTPGGADHMPTRWTIDDWEPNLLFASFLTPHTLTEAARGSGPSVQRKAANCAYDQAFHTICALRCDPSVPANHGRGSPHKVARMPGKGQREGHAHFGKHCSPERLPHARPIRSLTGRRECRQSVLLPTFKSRFGEEMGADC